MTEEEEKSLLKPNERIDDLQRNHLRIIQNPERFSFGLDAVLLAGYAQALPGERVLDLGTGTGIIPLLLSARTRAGHFTALEIQSESADMARRSVLLNGLQDRIAVLEGDVKEADALLAPASYDVVVANPPYMPAGRGQVNPLDSKAIARHELLCTFADIARVTERLLKPGGHFYLVHRTFRLPELMATLRERHLEPKRMRLVYPSLERGSDLVLLACVRGGRPELMVERPLVIWDSPGVYTREIRELYGF